MTASTLIATVDMRGVVLFFLVAALFGLLAIGALLTTLGRRRRAVWLLLIAPLALTPLVFGDRIFGPLAGIAASVLAVLALLLPNRARSDEEGGGWVPSTVVLTLVALLGIGAFGLYFINELFSDVSARVSETIVIEPSSDGVATYRVTVRVADPTSGGIVRDLSAGGVQAWRDPDDDRDCRGCDAHYSVAVFAAEGDRLPPTVTMAASVSVPRWKLGRADAPQVEFTVEDTTANASRIPFAAGFETMLPASRPFTLLRVRAEVPAPAVTTTNLRQWPTVWRSSSMFQIGDSDPADLITGFGPGGCRQGEACQASTIRAIVFHDAEPAAQALSATVSGALFFFEPPLPPEDVTINVEIDEPIAWHVVAASGSFRARGDYDHNDELSITAPVPEQSGDLGAIVVITYRTGDDVRDPEVLKANCYRDVCELTDYSGFTPEANVTWDAEFHFGFFDGPVPGDFVVGEITAEHREILEDY